MRTRHPLTACALLSASLLAQRPLVVPEEFTKLEGAEFAHDQRMGCPWVVTSTTAPGDRYVRLQTVIDMPRPVRGALSRIAFRREGQYPNALAVAFTAILDIRCSTSSQTSSTLSPAFQSNVGRDEQMVFTRKRVSFGVPALQRGVPQPFLVTLALDRAFTYDSSRGSLLIEYRSYDNDLYDPQTQQRRGLTLDAFQHYTGQVSTVRGVHYYGPASTCYASGKAWPYAMESVASIQVHLYTGTGSASWLARHLTPSMPALLAVATRLLPGRGIALGCGTLQLDPATLFVALPVVADSRGNALVPPSGYVTFPWQIAFSGLATYAQFLGLDGNGRLAAANYYVQYMPVVPRRGNSFGIASLYLTGPTAFTGTTGTPTNTTVRENGTILELTF